MILNSGSSSFDNYFFIGNLLVFINATSYAIYLVLVKGLMKKYQPLTVMFFVFLFGLFFVFPFGYQHQALLILIYYPRDIYLKVLFVVVCTTFIAYLFNAFALKTLSPSVVSIYIYLQPVLASVIAIIYNSDSIDYIKILSSFFIFTAVFLVSIPSKKVITN